MSLSFKVLMDSAFFMSSVLGEFFPELKFRLSWSTGDGVLALETCRRIRAEDNPLFLGSESLFITLVTFSSVWNCCDWRYRGEVRDFLRTDGTGL